MNGKEIDKQMTAERIKHHLKIGLIGHCECRENPDIDDCICCSYCGYSHDYDYHDSY